MKKLFLTILTLVSATIAMAQNDAIKFTSEIVTTPCGKAAIVFKGSIAPGWHVYSTDLKEGGPVSASFKATKLDGVELVGKLKAVGHEIDKFDNMFEMQVRYFENEVKFVQVIRFTKPTYSIEANLNYGSCNDKTCLPPAQVIFKQQGNAPKITGKTCHKEGGNDKQCCKQKEDSKCGKCKNK